MNNDKKTLDQFEALHLQIQDLLAGYSDNMLSEQERMIVESHLAGCEACRIDVEHQQLLGHRLNEMLQVRMPETLHQRIDQALSKEQTPEIGDEIAKKTNQKANEWSQIFNLDWFLGMGRASIMTLSGWGVAMLLLLILIVPSLRSNNNIPMIQEVMTEYRYLNTMALPVSNRAIPLVAPATWPGSYVLANWKTTIGGAPADAFAVRSGDHVVFQYRIDETVFFRNPNVRKAVAGSGNFKSKNKNLGVLALPLKRAGLLIVGADKSLPAPEELTLRTI